MSVSDWTGIVVAVIAFSGLVLAGVRKIIMDAVADNNQSHRIDALATQSDDHDKADTLAFARIDQKFDDGDKVMKVMNERAIRTDEKVNLLVQWQTGANPESRARRHDDTSG